MLKDNLIPDLDEDDVFSITLAPSHKSRVTQQSLADEGGTVLKDRSAQSLNFDIIKQMWTEIKKRVRQKNLRNYEVWALSYRPWYLIPEKKEIKRQVHQKNPRNYEGV